MSFLKDSVWTFAAQGAQALAQLATGVVLARVLLAEGRGEYGLLVLVPTTAVVIAGLGLGTASLRSVSKERARAPAALANALVAALVLGAIAALALFAWHTEIAAFVGTPADGTALTLALVAVPLLVFDQYAALLLTGMGAVIAANLLKLVQAAAMLLLLPVTFAYFGRNVDAALAAFVLSYAASDLACLVYALRRAGGPLRFDAPLLREGLSFGLRTLPASLAMFLLFRSDLFLVRAYRSLAEVGVYSLATSLAIVFQLAARSVERAFAPRVMARDAAAASALTPRVTRAFVLVMTPLALLAGALGFALIPLVFGDAFRAAALVFALFLPGMVIGNIGVLINGDLLSRGFPLAGSTSAIACLAVNVTLNVLWIPRFGLVGAACASALTYACYGVFVSLLYRRVSRVTLRELFVPTIADVRAVRELVLGRVKHRAR
ncbi:MAG: oligosaccharide flippase family protein [Planctomycetota bacterium]